MNSLDNNLVWSVSDFVAVFNQTVEYAYPSVVIVGELANFKISKGRWVYFDLKDEYSSVRFFGTVYALPGPLEDGMLIQVHGTPRLHPQFGFSITFDAIHPVGEGSIKKASELLEAKLRSEGLFDDSRKRTLPYPPQEIGLIASKESAAYHDFVKVLGQRWGGIKISFIDVQVQGESAPNQIISAIEQLNSETNVDVIVITRGGGSPEDLAAFSHELVVRAVALSRIPTLVAIGHEVDVSLAELAADRRASTPSNAAEMIVPDKQQVISSLGDIHRLLGNQVAQHYVRCVEILGLATESIHKRMRELILGLRQELRQQTALINLLDPATVLRRGYAVVRDETGKSIKTVDNVRQGDRIGILLSDGEISASVTAIKK